MLDTREFRNALGKFASGVTVVTTLDQGVPHGITVSAFMSVSLKPPLIAVSISKKSQTHSLLAVGTKFGVSVLREGQERVSDFYADRPAHVSNPLEEAAGFPFVRDSLARLLCKATSAFDAGDHTIIVGEVERVWYAAGRPLVYCQGRYQGLAQYDFSE